MSSNDGRASIPIGLPKPQPSLRSSLLDYAESTVPDFGGTAVSATVLVMEDDGVQIAGVVQWRDSLTGRLVYERRATGERGILGQIVWRPGKG